MNQPHGEQHAQQVNANIAQFKTPLGDEFLMHFI